MSSSKTQIQSYRVEYGLETVKMWRRSFQRAMGLEAQNRLSELVPQLDYFSTIEPASIRVAVEPEDAAIVGMMVLSGSALDHLYIHVDYQGCGLGSRFLRLAKEESPAGIELYTFQKNTGARKFYESHGFVEIERGFAAALSNPWATRKDELADIRFRWTPDSPPD